MKQENKVKDYIVKKNLKIEDIVDDYYNYISTIIKNSGTLSIEDEEEIISDVFLIIWKNKDKLDRNARFSPYIAGITKKVILRKYNKLKTDFEYVEYENELIDNFDMANTIEWQEKSNLINENIKHIGKVEYEIFTKFYYQDKRIKQIAKEMNLSVSNVKTKLHRIRKKVKEILKVGGYNI